MPLPSHGNAPLKRPIIPRTHFPKLPTNASPSTPATDVVSPLPSPKRQKFVGGPSNASISS